MPGVEIRAQVEFWPKFFDKITKREDKAQILQTFEQLILKLLGHISTRSTMEPDTWESLNKINQRDSVFDEMFAIRRDLGDILRAICRCIGPTSVLQLFNGELAQSTAKLQTGNLDIDDQKKVWR